MKKIAKKLFVLLMVMLLTLSPMAAIAAEDISSEANEVENVMEVNSEDGGEASLTDGENEFIESNTSYVSDVVPISSAEGNADASVFENTGEKTYADFDFSGLQTLSGIFSSVGTYITVPKYCSAKLATLRLAYTCSDLILTELSSLTFYMNGTPFYSCPVAYKVGEPTMVYVDVPLNLFKDEFNFLEVRAYVRLTDDEGCVDDFMGANWINIEEETMVRVTCDLVDDMDYISYFPYPFLSIYDTTGENLDVCVSEKADEKELTAALELIASVGEVVSEDNDIRLTTIGKTSRNNVILFSTYDNLPAEYKAFIDDKNVNDSTAYIKRITDGSKEILIVTSKSADALHEGATFLGDDSRVKQITSSTHSISVGEKATLIQNSDMNDTIVQEKYTLKEISGSGVWLYGPFHREAIIYLPVPNDYALSADSKFTFNFRYSENLDFTRSLITVFWGDIPITSKKLTKENAMGDTLSFIPPVDLVGVNGSSIKITFELEIQDMICTPRQEEMPWAYVAENSTLYLPSGKAGMLDLANLPAPFQRNGRFSDLLVVMPDEPDEAEYQLASNVMAVLGYNSSPYGNLKVIKASSFSEDDSDYNIVAIGKPVSNSFIKDVNGSLHFKYNEAFDSVVSNDKLTVEEEYSSRIGTVQLINSPFSDERACILFSAPTDAGVSSLNELMRNSINRWDLNNDAVVVSDGDEVTSYKFYAQSSTDDEVPTFLESLKKNVQGGLFAIIAIGVILILLIAVILVMIRAKLANKH